MLNSCFVFNFIQSFIISILLFIVFIPGLLFTIPSNYKDRTDTISKIIVGVIHGTIFIIIYSIISCKK